MHKDHPEYAIDDPNAPPLTKDAYLKRAGDALRTAEQIEGRIARSATTEKPATKYPIILDVKGMLDLDEYMQRANWSLLLSCSRCNFWKV